MNNFSPFMGIMKAAALVGVMLIRLPLEDVQAAIPQDGVYTACYIKPGQVRIIDAATASCRKEETQITWKQTGDPGPIGPAGPRGVQGPPGPVAPKADGMCFDNTNRYVDCGNGTVTDTITGLIWLKDPSCLGKADWTTANHAAAALADGSCGLTDKSSAGDWRLPTRVEWEATFASGNFLNCLPALTNTPGTACYSDGPQPFPGVLTRNLFWSSTSTPATTSLLRSPVMAFGGNMSGAPGDAEFKTDALLVWPIRGGGH